MFNSEWAKVPREVVGSPVLEDHAYSFVSIYCKCPEQGCMEILLDTMGTGSTALRQLPCALSETPPEVEHGTYSQEQVVSGDIPAQSTQ